MYIDMCRCNLLFCISWRGYSEFFKMRWIGRRALDPPTAFGWSQEVEAVESDGICTALPMAAAGMQCEQMMCQRRLQLLWIMHDYPMFEIFHELRLCQHVPTLLTNHVNEG